MKKYFSLCVITLFVANIYSQNKYFGTVNYTQNYNLVGYSNISDYKLSFNDEVSFYEQNLLAIKNKQEISSKEEKTEILVNPSEATKNFLFTNYKKNKLYFNTTVTDKYILVEDEVMKVDWQLLEEFKKIGEFNCQKAKCTFRGRNYYAWFTSEIPVKYGPWKFSGLSGLILEVFEENYKLHIIAKEIILSKEEMIDFDKINKIDLTKAIKTESLSEEITKIRIEFLTKLNSKLPKGVKPFKLDGNCNNCGEELEIFNSKNEKK